MKRICKGPIATLRLPQIALVVALVCLMHSNARAATFTSVANGTWDTGAPWGNGGSTPGVDFPASGDDANIGHNLAVSSPEEFGVAAGNSTWTGGNFDLTDTLTLLDGTLEYTGSSEQMNGLGGVFINQGTIEQNSATTIFLGVADDTIFRNQDTFDFVNAASTSHVTLHGVNLDPANASRFIHETGATIRRTASGLSEFNVHPNTFGTFEAESGSIFNAVDAATRINMESANATNLGQIVDATFQGNGQIEFQGYWSEISGTVAGAGSAELDGGASTAHFVPASGTTYDVTGNTSGLEWAANHISLTGNAMNNGTFTVTGTSQQINGAGEFINSSGSEFRVDTSGNLFIAVSGGDTTFRNAGTLRFLDTGSLTFFAHNQGGTFLNESTGVIRRDVTGSTLFTDSGGNGDFNNLGTVEVTAGTIQIASSLATTSVSGGSQLTQGAWNVLSGTGTATLDLDAGGTGAGSIITVGSTASVLMGGNNPVFSQLSGGSLTVNGSFGVQNQYIHSLSGSLTAPGTLLFGLEAADVGGTLLTGLDIAGNADFTGGTVDILDLGDMVEGTYRLIEWDGSLTGLLSLGSVPDNGFAYNLVTTGTGPGFVNLEVSAPVVPEPSTALLLLIGIAGLTQVRMVRRNPR